MAIGQTVSIRDIIQELTGGAAYVFMIRSFDSRGDEMYRRIRSVVWEQVQLECIDAGAVPGAGHDLLAKVHVLIERAELVIAEISTKSPNVFYEVGYAAAAGKPMLLVAEKDARIPANLAGRLLITHDNSTHGMQGFEHELRQHLGVRVNSQLALLRDMLQARTPEPAYIVASPKFPPKDPSVQPWDRDTRTFGDNLGIRGLISAFGLMFGEGFGVELVSAQYYPLTLVDDPLSLYLIGSKKVNPVTEVMLDRLQRGREPKWVLGPEDSENEQGGYELCCTLQGDTSMMPGEREPHGPGGWTVDVVDHGILIRGPHPQYPERLVMIMAGPHSLGTGAACLAATSSPLIQEIGARLKKEHDVGLADKDKTLWVLVRGEVSRDDWRLNVEGVSIEEVGVYE